LRDLRNFFAACLFFLLILFSLSGEIERNKKKYYATRELQGSISTVRTMEDKFFKREMSTYQPFNVCHFNDQGRKFRRREFNFTFFPIKRRKGLKCESKANKYTKGFFFLCFFFIKSTTTSTSIPFQLLSRMERINSIKESYTIERLSERTTKEINEKLKAVEKRCLMILKQK
jgi:hypothetical protein